MYILRLKAVIEQNILDLQNFFNIDTAGHLFLSSKYKNYLFSLLGTALTKI